jgi:hypothetical protein
VTMTGQVCHLITNNNYVIAHQTDRALQGEYNFGPLQKRSWGRISLEARMYVTLSCRGNAFVSADAISTNSYAVSKILVEII